MPHANFSTLLKSAPIALLAALALAGCAEDEIRRDETPVPSTEAARPDPVPATPTAAAPGAAPATTPGAENVTVAELQKRLQGLESHVVELQSQLDAKFEAKAKKDVQAVVPHPATGAGTAVAPAALPGDPEAGFANDEAIQAYRKAMVLFQAQKFPESILGFSSFLEGHPDHALAGSAQFYLGEAYFKQREYTLALKEYQRVLTSYDRSSRVADTLKQMAEAEDLLKRPQEASRHRQLLTSLFPQSPAARVAIRAEVQPTAPAPSAPTETKPAETPASNSGSSIDPVPGTTEPAAPVNTAPANGASSAPTAPIAPAAPTSEKPADAADAPPTAPLT